jgi:uncharacterized protein (TIGR01777 family)
MKYQKIILAGGNGYLGGVMANYYKGLTKQVIILSRRAAKADGNVTTLVWDGINEGAWSEAMERADLLINLCGKNVNCRYTQKNQAEIIRSRINPTKLLGRVIGKLKHPPLLWITITSATVYRHAEDHPQDELNGDIGYGFSIDVCKQWEEEFYNCITPQTRKITLRMGIVLGRSDGAFPRLSSLVKLGLGGKQGDGKQYVSWVHEQDAAKCTEFLLSHQELSGDINCVAPQPLQNALLMKHIRNALGIPLGLPAPAWLLGIGARLIGTEVELILKSRWVLPRRLMDSGYTFLFVNAEHAIKDILSTRI